MKEIRVTVRDKIATGDGTRIVCGNSDYVVRFDLDSEWEQFLTRTMVVVYADKTYEEVTFTGETAELPVISDRMSIAIGLYAGDLHTTTGTVFDCIKSVRCGLGEHYAPSEDVYNQLVSLVESGAVKGDKGEPGKTAYQYALDGGYTGTEEEFAAKLAQEIPVIDTTLTQEGKAADAKAVGDKFGELSKEKVDSNETVSDMVVGTSVEEKCAEFSALMKNAGEVESFIFFTDPHLLAAENDYEAEFRDYIRTLKTYYAATPTSFVVCGGDWLELHSRSEACFRLGYADAWMRNNFDRYYSTVGNHDHNVNTSGVTYPAGSDVGVLSINTVRNLMMRNEKNTYYTFDGDNTTFYVLDSGPAWWSMTAHMWEQIAWLADELKTKDAKNSAIIVHAAYEADSSGEIVLQAFMTNVLALCGAYNEAATITLNSVDYNFSGCTGKMRFVLSGHKHGEDYHEAVNGIQIVRTTSMRTGSSPTFELCLADYDNNLLHLVRVGSGSSRTLELARPNTLYPDDTMVFLAGKEPDGTAINTISYANFGCAVGTVATDVRYTDSENSVEYFAMIKPYGATKVSVKCPGLSGVFTERDVTGYTLVHSGWIDDGFEYTLQSDTWYYVLKFRTNDGSDFKDYDTSKISWEFSGQIDTSYTNQILTSIDKDGTVYNGFGYKPFTRVGTGTGKEVDHATYSATGFISAKYGDVFRVKNISMTGESAVILFDENFSYVNASYLNSSAYSIDENGVLSGTLNDSGNIAYIRVTGDFGVNPIVTINEEIV